MAESVTYKLTGDYDAKTFGGNFALGDGTLYDVAKALKDGNGSITTSDESLITALDVYDAVDRAAPAKPTTKQEQN